MKFILRFLKILFTLATGTIFILTFFLFVPCYFLIFTFYPKTKAPFRAHRLSQWWGKTLLTVFLVRTKVINREFIDPHQTYVFVANHRSQLDIPAYVVSCQNTLRFLAKKELTKIPMLGYVINKLYISVDRKNKEARIRSLESMMNSLKDGISVFICPEGTRNQTDQPLLDFHDGAFRLAIESQLPLAVLTVSGTDILLSPLHPFELSPGTIRCVWSKPFLTKGMTMNDLPRLKELAKNSMLENLK